MYWVVLFIEAWVIFLVLVDYKGLKRNLIGGILALLLGTLVDWGAQKLQLYEFYNLVIPWLGCSAFYKLGPILIMGILFVQFLPENRYLQAVNILMVACLYALIEYLTILSGTAKYLHWSIFASLVLDILVFSALTWFSVTFIKKKKAKSY